MLQSATYIWFVLEGGVLDWEAFIVRCFDMILMCVYATWKKSLLLGWGRQAEDFQESGTAGKTTKRTPQLTGWH